jgi:hypothetical protein
MDHRQGEADPADGLITAIALLYCFLLLLFRPLQPSNVIQQPKAYPILIFIGHLAYNLKCLF